MSAPCAGKAEDRPVSTRVPPAEVLLDAAADYLDLELRPSLDGYHAFQLRVCVNVLRLVARELRLGPEADARARAGLAALLGASGSAEAQADAPAPDDALRAEIAAGRLPLDSPALLAYLRDGLRDALAINNPRWVQPGGDTGG